jgi:sulfofructose kinase
MLDVLCIGHASYDISVFVSGYPAENSKAETDLLLEAGGGPSANAAYLLSFWGAACAFAGLVGDDSYGRRVVAELEVVGAGVSLVERREGHPTPVSVVVVNRENGSRTIVNRKAPHGALHLTAGALAGMSPKVLLFDGHEPQASLVALAAFPETKSVLDAGSLRDGTAALAGKVDYLVSSERYARQVCDIASLDDESNRRACLEELRRRYGNTVVVTLGERGLIADDGGGYFTMPAFKTRAVDTTGAGDVFHGAFAYGIARQMTFRETLRLASMAASLSVAKQGTRASFPGLTEVEETLAHAE